ncbi:trehalose-phosphatase [Georgenia sp. TF02-10]|uniref:trehalose-phosphatase n=1 Tax=Georgenia sp. TF02-10 TaxID=2917725 RepID=UPI001FA7FECD|nr:trehalose-phosphatase [Georgenia sp. TF02-10]UNX55282.1 trehalose-phosphatase [Georgenia sp. TF02-10]
MTPADDAARPAHDPAAPAAHDPAALGADDAAPVADPGVPGPGVDAPLFTAHLQETLDAALRAFAAVPAVLVALDFDGVLAPIVLDPTTSRVTPASAQALAALAEAPGVSLAVVSGREAEELVALAEVPVGTRVVGSHGAQLGTVSTAPTGGRTLAADPVRLTPAQAELRAQLLRETEALAAQVPGAWVQAKPTAVVLHTRPAAPDDGARLTEAVLAGPAARPEVRTIVGKEVVEMAVLDVTKGDALVQLRDAARAGAVLYAGDDTTDEDAFAVLGPDDVGVKVGDGDTAAGYRVTDPDEVSLLLLRLVELRAEEGPRGRGGNPAEDAASR